MKISEAKNITLKEFSALDTTSHSSETEAIKNHPIRNENETFMDFIKAGSEKIKHSPIIKTTFSL